MALMLNYFGCLQPEREEIRRVCAARGTVLVEDTAHSMLTPGSGETGDLAVFSYRKLLPVPDGGGLRLNHGFSGEGPGFRPRILSDILSFLIRLKLRYRIRSSTFSRAGLAGMARKEPAAEAPPRKIGRIMPMSGFTARRLRTFPLAEIIARRRADFQFWLELTRDREELKPLIPELPAEVCPYGFPVLCQERDALQERFLAAGIPVSVQWRLPDVVGPEHVVSHRLSADIMTLPVYPDLGPETRERGARLLGAASPGALVSIL